MKRYKSKINAVAVTLLLLTSVCSILLIAEADEYEPMWSSKMLNPQFPDPTGWDIASNEDHCLADDWQCTETGPVTDIHWWGSWDSNDIGEILGWQIRIFSDINASQSPTGYSMPDELLWNQYITVFNMSEQTLSPQGMYYPWIPYYNFDNHNRWFRYDITNITEPFIQINGTIYWLCIYPILAGPQSWGWKSSQNHWNDDAVYNDSVAPFWKEIYEPPDFIESMDLAFIIGGPSNPMQNWTHKMHYPQLPNETGWDVQASLDELTGIGTFLVDDWMCSRTGTVDDIHFWGSWLNDTEGILNGFHIYIFSDNETKPGPNATLWYQYISNFNTTLEFENFQGWYDPEDGMYYNDNHVRCFRYDITNITEPFFQIEGTIYWLGISADINSFNGPISWGWKSSDDHWRNDSMYLYSAIPPLGLWRELLEPPDFEKSLDLAFVITGAGYDGNSTMNISGLTDNNLTWSGYGGEPDVWCNNSGSRDETLEIDLLINGTVNCSGINLWLGDLYNSSVNYWVNASNMTVYVSTDNNTFFLLNQTVGNGDGVPLDGGCNLTINYTTWGTPTGNPWLLYGNQNYITTSCSIYVRIEMNIPVPFYYDNHTIWQKNYSSVRFSNSVPWCVYANGSGPFAYDDFGGLLVVQKSWFRKPGYTNCTYGVPDFDCKQVNGTTIPWDFLNPYSGLTTWYMDGPTALFDCLWWLDCRAHQNGRDYFLPDGWSQNDSKNPRNVAQSIEWLSLYLKTASPPMSAFYGTSAENMTEGITDVFNVLGINDTYKVTVEGYRDYWETPEFISYENITKELDTCQDVILLIGYWTVYEMQWYRIGGHYVQCNGYSREDPGLSFSDPYYDMAEQGGMGWFSNHTIPHDASSHNNTNNVSYDYWYVCNDSMSPGGNWWIPNYMPSDAMNWSGTNWWDNCPHLPVPPVDLVHPEIEMAWYICYDDCIEVNKTVWNGTSWAKNTNASKGEEVTFNLTIHNCGKDITENLTINEEWFGCLGDWSYVNNSCYVTYPNGTKEKVEPDIYARELEWTFLNGSFVNWSFCQNMYIEYNMTLKDSLWGLNIVEVHIWNDTEDLAGSESNCTLNSLFNLNITCTCDGNENQTWLVSEHVTNGTLDQDWLPYTNINDTDLGWNACNVYPFGDSYRFNAESSLLLDNNGITYTIANLSCQNRSQSLARLRYWYNAGEGIYGPFAGTIYSFINNSYYDAVLVGLTYEGSPKVTLISKRGNNLYNTNDSTLITDVNSSYNYWWPGWPTNGTLSAIDINPLEIEGVWIKTIYNEYCGKLQTKVWQGCTRACEGCNDEIGLCREPAGWVVENAFPSIQQVDASCFGLIVWYPNMSGDWPSVGAAFDFIEDWRLNYSLNQNATYIAQHSPNLSEGIPCQDWPEFDYSAFEPIYNTYNYCYNEWLAGNITDIEYYDCAASFERYITNINFGNSRPHKPTYDLPHPETWNQNDTIYYSSSILTNKSDQPDSLLLYIENAPDGTDNEYDGCCIAIDVDNNQQWDDNDMCFVWYMNSTGDVDYKVWNGTTMKDNSSNNAIEQLHLYIENGSCMYNNSNFIITLPLHRYQKHREFSALIPTYLLEKNYVGSYEQITKGDTFGLSILTFDAEETSNAPMDRAVAWQNWNETSCTYLVVNESIPYSTWDTYMNISNDMELGNFFIDDIWNGTNSSHMQYWGVGGVETETSDPWAINITKVSNISTIINTTHNTSVNFTVTVCNNASLSITNITVEDTFPNCCEYISSSLPKENVTHPGNHTLFNVTGFLEPEECMNFNITVNFTANCGVPNGTILYNVVNASCTEPANATYSCPVRYGNNSAPVINWTYPTNNQINTPLTLNNFSCYIYDADNDSLNISFYSNKTDGWTNSWNLLDNSYISSGMTEWNNKDEDFNYFLPNLSQTFTVGTNGPNIGFVPTSVKVKILNGAGTVTAQITPVDGAGKPANNTVLASDSSIISGTGWFEFNFTTTNLLSASTKYALVLLNGSGDWYCNLSGNYTGGDAYHWAGGAWWGPDGPNMNYMFEIYGEWYSYSGRYIWNDEFNYSTDFNTRWRWGNTTYWWSINVTDGLIWTNETIKFTTNRPRCSVNNDSTVDVFDLSLTWAHRTTGGHAVYHGIYDVAAIGQVDVFDLSYMWSKKTV